MRSDLSKTILVCLASVLTSSAWAATKIQPNNSLSYHETQVDKNFGVSVEPLWLVLSGIGAKFEYFATKTVSIGLSGIYIPDHPVEKSSDTSDSTENKYNYRWSYNEINLGTNIMLTGTLSTSGVYINPAVGYQNSRITDFSDLKLQGSLSSPQAKLTAGYQWVNRDSNLRIAVGGGAKVVQASEIVIKDEAGNDIYKTKSSDLGGLALDLHLGFLF